MRAAILSTVFLMMGLAACTAPVPRADAPLPDWKVLGLGNATCAGFADRVAQPRERDPWVQWVWGYFSARNAPIANIDNVIGVSDLNDPLTDDPVDWLQGWCAQHLQAPFQHGVQALLAKEIRDMRSRRIQENAKDPVDMELPGPGDL